MREEYKQFEKNTDAIRAAFENALTNCDNEIFKHEPQIVEMMASVAAFEFDEDEIQSFDSADEAWHTLTISMQVAVYEWLEVLDMPKGDLRKFKADIMRVYHHPSGYIDGVGEKYAAVDTLNEEEYEDGLNGREWVRTEYRSRNYFRRLVSIARKACADHAGEIANAADRGAAQAQGVADRIAANLSGVIEDFKKAIQAANLTGAPAQISGRNVGGVSQSVMAGFMEVSLSTIKKWEHPEKPYNPRPPVVDGIPYTAAIRANGAGAFMYAQRYKDTQRGALKTIGGDKGAGVAEKQAAQKWIAENAAALREAGANPSERDF